MSHTPKNILVPTDLSDLASVALRFGGDLRDRTDGNLTVLFADPFLPPPEFMATQVDEMAAGLERSKKLARSGLERYALEQLGARSRQSVVVIEALPVPAIVGWAENHGADLIVMGTHGRSGLNRVMMGSVTERVLRETDVPVLAVRADSAGRAGAIRRIVCPVNFTEVAHHAVEYAIDYAQLFGAELTLLFVAEESDPRTDDEIRKVDGWIPPTRQPVTNLVKLVRRGDAAAQVIDYACASSADLIILGAQHKRFADTTVIGTTTVRVTRHASCPVLTVIRRAEDREERGSGSDASQQEVTAATADRLPSH